LSGSEPEDQPAQAEETKRKRRSKVEMIADAVIPGDAEMVALKDTNTGTKVERAWREAVELVSTGAAEFVDKAMKYAVIKQEQQKAAPAFDQGTAPTDEEVASLAQQVDRDSATPSDNIPPEAEVGDEVRVGADVFRVGHDNTLTSGPVSVDGNVVGPKRTWQRELGTGGKGPWEVVQTHPVPEAIQAETNGHGGDDIRVETERLPHTQQFQDDGTIKIGTGILEKIGLPDYSNLSIGPVTISRVIVDDGRRTKVDIGGREGEIITAAAEGFEVLDNTVEFVVRRFRGQLQAFLEATGALNQPVS
jgi:hypothetical protein